MLDIFPTVLEMSFSSGSPGSPREVLDIVSTVLEMSFFSGSLGSPREVMDVALWLQNIVGGKVREK